MSLLLPLLAFIFATALVAVAGLRLAPNRGSVIDRRLAELTDMRGRPDTQQPAFGRAKELLKRIGSRAPRPRSELGKVRQRLVQAGYRGEEALAIFYGIRVSVALAAFVLFATPLVFRPNVMFGLGGSLLGYVVPGILLAKRPPGASTGSSCRCPTRSTCWS